MQGTFIQITPGAGAMFCGNCLRDNALVAALSELGCQTLMVPLYLPLTLDEKDETAGKPIFFGGINVYLGQQSSLFRSAPGWIHDLFSSRTLLKWAAGKAAQTRPEDLGELTLSMLRGEEGNQARELDQLIDWLKTQPQAGVLCLSNALLIGMARRLKSELRAPMVCMLQGEEGFLEALPEPHRTNCWRTIAERSAEVDMFIAPSRFFADLMRQKLGLPKEKVRVVYNGINLDGYSRDRRQHDPNAPVVIGYFARMCHEKGLDTLVDAYLILRQRGRLKNLRLHVGGSCGPSDELYIAPLKEKLKAANCLDTVQFFPNVDRADKIKFLRSLSIFSVPARYTEAFGLYLIEALAAGVPIVQPQTAAFPEIVEATGGGVLYQHGDPESLANELETLLLNSEKLSKCGMTGQQAVFERFNSQTMARETLKAIAELKK